MTPFERLLLDCLAETPRTGYELARAVEERIPDSLSGREGFLYPALLALEKRGLIIGAWEVREAGRRRVYRHLADEESEDVA